MHWPNSLNAKDFRDQQQIWPLLLPCAARSRRASMLPTSHYHEWNRSRSSPSSPTSGNQAANTSPRQPNSSASRPDRAHEEHSPPNPHFFLEPGAHVCHSTMTAAGRAPQLLFMSLRFTLSKDSLLKPCHPLC